MNLLETAVTAAIAAAPPFVALMISKRSNRRLAEEAKADSEAWRVRVEREILEAGEERNRLLDALGDAFMLVDSAGRIRFANSAARSLLGPRELVGRTIGETLVDTRLAQPILRCVETGEAMQSRIVLSQQTSPRGDRETRGINAWVIDAARLPTSQDPEPITRVILRDVTSEHQTEQVRKDFVANASHELRTPMAIIGGYLENLLDDNVVDDPETTRRFLSVMRKHSDRISRIIEDMLVISKLESGEANSLNVEPFRFRACIQDVIERLESVIRNQNAEIRTEMNDEGLVIRGDRFYWTQVLFNLVENALKQNPRPRLKVTIGCERTEDGTRIWVEDNGIGIPSADLPHIFRRFYRVEKHHSQQEVRGTGLGLSIVKRAVEAHGGSIGVTSVPGQATRFTILVPRDGSRDSTCDPAAASD
jgi:two-component system phosphate regulon sensor histidine kinase PhoR